MRKFKQVKRKEIVFASDEWSRINHLAAEGDYISKLVEQQQKQDVPKVRPRR